jgi:hypothetical protein
MDKPGAPELTELLLAWREGDEEALARLAPLVHSDYFSVYASESYIWLLDLQ